MKATLLFGSSRGNTRTVASRIGEWLDFPITVVGVDRLDGASGLIVRSDLLIFMASTWGDGELQADMERFLVHTPLQMGGKPYVICELGNYYGYDDFEFGAADIIKHFLDAAGGKELVEPFSMDSLPLKDWDTLARWCRLINAAVEQSLCTT
jgi:flavodoxin